MTKILDWRKSDDPRDVVHLAVQAIAEGHVIAVPSDVGYVLIASALQPRVVEQLGQIAATSGQPIAILPRAADETLDFFPDVSDAARRLVRKIWPGPLVLELSDSHPLSAMRCLDESITRTMQSADKTLKIWQPCHEVIDYISRLSSGPLVCVQATAGTDQKPTRNISEIGPNQYVLAIDEGTIPSVGRPTMIRIDGNAAKLTEPGLISASALRQYSQLMILFVCTGNTCRSPMAQALMTKKIQDRFGHLAKDGSVPIVTRSAGVSAFGDDPASHGALQAIANYGLSLASHQSTQINTELVEQADLILAMGTRHRHVIVSQWPSLASKVHLISPDGGEISDPFGGPLEIYQKCAEQLDRHTSYWAEQLDISTLLQWQE